MSTVAVARLSPGALTISHVDFGADWFAFVLVLEHPLLGEILSQTGLFRERRPGGPS